MTYLDLAFSAVALVMVILGVAYFVRFFGVFGAIHISGGADDGDGLDALSDKKQHLLDELRDAELDFRMGKISADDYARERARLEPQAVRAIRALDDAELRAEEGGHVPQ